MLGQHHAGIHGTLMLLLTRQRNKQQELILGLLPFCNGKQKPEAHSSELLKGG
jgi:hypothetical protein